MPTQALWVSFSIPLIAPYAPTTSGTHHRFSSPVCQISCGRGTSCAVSTYSCCVRSRPYRFFNVTRCLKFVLMNFGNHHPESLSYLEYLSSGENLAGCADFVTVLSRTFLRVYILLPVTGSSVYMRCIFARAYRRLGLGRKTCCMICGVGRLLISNCAAVVGDCKIGKKPRSKNFPDENNSGEPQSRTSNLLQFWVTPLTAHSLINPTTTITSFDFEASFSETPPHCLAGARPAHRTDNTPGGHVHLTLSVDSRLPDHTAIRM